MKKVIPICDIGLNKTEHLLSCLCSFDKYTVVDLKKTEQLQNFARFWSNFVDTARV